MRRIEGVWERGELETVLGHRPKRSAVSDKLPLQSGLFPAQSRVCRALAGAVCRGVLPPGPRSPAELGTEGLLYGSGPHSAVLALPQPPGPVVRPQVVPERKRRPQFKSRMGSR